MAATGARAAVVGEGTGVGIGAEEKVDSVDEVMEPSKVKGSRKSALVWVNHLAVILLVVLWTIPTLGIFVASFQTKEQIAAQGWWQAFSASERSFAFRTPSRSEAVEEGGKYVLRGNVFGDAGGTVTAFGTSVRDPAAFQPGEEGALGNRGKLTVEANGDYELAFNEAQTTNRGQRIFLTAETPADLTTANYTTVLNAAGVYRSFINSFTVAIPATIIPILIAAFAAYALAWMKFPGRALLVALVVGLLVVPLQMSLIPLLSLYNDIGAALGMDSKSYLGVWLAHTGFGLPLAIYLLRNYMVGLPREIMESARVDGASDFEIFMKIILPLSFPALASFAIFQFLWTWNDLLVALVFLGQTDDKLVLTGRLVALLGSRGGDWEILATSAFISIIVPIIVFLALQRYLVRGLLSGSVKG